MLPLGLLFLLLFASDTASATPLAGANADLNQVCGHQNGGTFVSFTTQANSATANDVGQIDSTGGANYNYIAFGMNSVFDKIYVDYSTAGTTGTVTWQYWNGAWVALSGVTDGTGNLKNAAGTYTVSWTLPSDWATTTVDATACGGPYYYMRLSVATGYGTNPRLDQISPVEYNLQVRVNDELGTGLTGLTSSNFGISGGTTNNLFGLYEIGSGDYYLSLDATGADTNFNVAATIDGYVQPAALATGTLTTSLTDKTSTPFSMAFSQKVTVTREVDNAALTGATITGGSATWVESGAGVYYGAVALANDGGTITITKAGYVTNTAYSMTDRVAHTDAQGDTSAGSVRFSQKVTITREVDAAALSGATVTSGGVTFIESGSSGIYYGNVLIGSDGTAITIAKAGYVTNAAFSTVDRTANTDAQGAVTATNVRFGQKVTVTREVDAAALSGATVVSSAITFIEDGSTGVYYAPIPIGSDNAQITITKAAYVTNTAFSTTDRTADTDAQGAVSATNVKFSQKVTVTRELDGAAFSGATVTSSAITFIESGATGVYYGAVPTTSDGAAITIAKSGYVTNTAYLTTDRSADTDAQGAVTATGIKFAQKVTVTREVDAQAFSGATVTSGGFTFVEDGATGIYYGAVPIASDGAAITIAKTGYVTNTAFSTTDRTADTDAQGDVTATNVRFSQKVTVTREGDAGPLNGASVTSSSVTFIENAATGVYYGAVPIATDGVTITIVKAGYVTNTDYATVDRTANTDAQGTVTATNVRFGQKITATREVDSGALSGATVVSNAITFTEIPALSGVYYGIVTPAQDGQTITITKAGYVTNTGFSTVDRSADTDAQGSTSAINVRFGQKVTITREVDSQALTGATVTSGGATFVEDGTTGIYYGAVPIANDNAAITIAKAGYVTNTATSTTDRTADADAQGASTATNVRFGQKVTITREVDSAIFSGATVTSGGVTFLEDGATGVYYGAVPIGSDNAAITIAKPGYVTNTGFSTTDRTADTDAQGSATGSNIQFSQKVTVTREADAGSISGATVTSAGVTFVESGTSGIYYGAVPIAGDGAAITIVKGGYVTNTAHSTVNRAADTDAQGSTSATGLLFGQKVTATREGDAGALTGATVTSNGVTYTEIPGSSGVYYAVMTPAQDGQTITIAKAGYVTNTAFSATNRAADTDAQGAVSATNVQFGQKITITREVDAAGLAGATVTSNGVTFSELPASSGNYYAVMTTAQDGLTITIQKDGYVTNTAHSTADRSADADAQGSVTASGILFAHKVTVTREADAAALSGATVTSGGATFVEDGATGVYYGAVLLANDNAAITIAKPGYVTNTAFSTGDRSAHTDAQGSVSATNVRFGQRVTITREVDAAALSGATVTSGGATFVEDGATGVYYGAVVIGSDNAAITIVKAGYVTNTAFSTTDRTADTDAQGSVSATNVLFGQRVTITREADAAALSSATVTSGGVTFVENGATGVYYGAVPIGSDNAAITIVKAGYVTNTAFSTTDRTANTDAQGSVTASNIRFGQKVTVTRQVDSTAITGAAVTSNGVTLTELPALSGVYYGVVTPAQDNQAITVVRDGYVTNTAHSTTDRAADTDAQGAVAASGVLFSQKVTVTRESDAAALSGATVTSGGVTFVEDGATGVYYGNVLVANDGASISVAKDGYVTNTAASTTNRAAHTEAQGNVAASNVLFTVKLTLATETGLGGVTFEKKIGAGSFNGVSPTVSSANVAYFAQTTSEADLVFRATKYGVSADTGAAFTASAASQAAYTLHLVGALTSTSSNAASLVAGAQTTYTFGFTAAHVWPANGKVAITLPAGYTIGSPAATLTGADGTATTSVAGQVVTVTRANDGTDTAGSTAITVALTQITNIPVSGSSGTFAFALQNSAATTLDSGTGPAVTITPGALSALSTNPVSLGVGDQTTYAFGFTNANPWPLGGKITVTFPAGYTIGSPAATLTGADGTATTSIAGQVVTVTRAGDGSNTPASTAITVALTQITNPVTMGATGTFALETQTAGSVAIDQGTAPSVTLDAGALDEIIVSPDAPTVVAGVQQAFSAVGEDQFDNPVTIDPTWSATCGTVDPDTGLFTAPTVAPQPCDVIATDGAISDASTASVVADELSSITVSPAHPLVQATTTRQFTAAGFDQYGNTVSITPDWSADCGSIDAAGLFTAPSTSQACIVTATEAPISGDTSLSITAAPLTALGTAAGAPNVDMVTTYTFKFKNGDPWPTDGKFQVTFPAQYTIGSPVVTLGGAKGTATASVAGQVITVTRAGDGIATPSGVGVSVKLTDIRNPPNAGVYGGFPIVMQDAAGVSINSGTTPAVTIKTVGWAPAPKPTLTTVDTATTYTMITKAPVNIPNDAKFVIRFPAGFDVSGATHTLTGVDGTTSLGISGNTLTITRQADGTPTLATMPLTLTLDNVKNPPTSGVTGTFLTAIRTPADVDLASGVPKGVKITTTALKAAAVPTVYAVGASTSIVFSATSTVPWPVDGVFAITMPAGLTAAAPSATFLLGADGTATATVTGQVVTVTRAADGTETPASTLMKIQVDGFTNPPAVATLKPFAFALRNAAGVDLAAGTAVAPKIVAEALSDMTSKAGVLSQGATTTYTFAFKAPRAWPADGKATVVFPADYSVGAPVLTMKGVTGTAGVSVSGNTVTVTRNGDGTEVLARSLITLILTDVTNPSWGGLSGTFSLAMLEADDDVIDAGSSPAVKLATGALTFLTSSPANAVGGVETTYTFGFTNANPWPNDGKLLIQFPVGFAFATPTATLTGADGTATVSVSGLIATVTRAGDGAQTAALTPITVALSGVYNTHKAGNTGAFYLTLANDDGKALNTGKAPVVAITANPLSVLKLASSTHGAGKWMSSTTVTMKWGIPLDLTTNGYSWELDSFPDEVVDGTLLTTSLTGVAEGQHTFYIKAKNAGGTWGPVVRYEKIWIDATLPVAPTVSSVTHPETVCAPSTNGFFSWGGSSDALSGMNLKKPYGYKLDALSVKQGLLTSVTLTNLASGPHTLTVYAYDQAFNANPTTYNFEVC